MLFRWSAKNLCIVFSSWRITGPFSLLLSLIAIVIITAGYEGVRRVTRRYELVQAQRLGAYTAAPVTVGKFYSSLFLFKKWFNVPIFYPSIDLFFAPGIMASAETH